MKWATAQLGEVCDIVSGATPKTGTPTYWDGDVAWATPKDISDLGQKHLNDTPRKITRLGLESCSATMLPPQSVLLSSRAPIGLVAVNTVPVSTNQGFKNLVPRNGTISADYLYWWFKSNNAFLQSLGRGATFKEISKAIVARIEIPLPPLAEQKRIAGILDAADALRAKRREALAQLDTLLQATFLDLFGDPITNTKRWEAKPIGQLFGLKHGYAFESEFFVSEGRYVLLTPGNFFEAGGFRDRGDRQKYYDEDVRDEYILNEGDLLIAMTEQAPGLLGSPILVPKSGLFLHNQRLGKVEKKTEIESLYIFSLMNAGSIRARIRKDSQGTKVKHTSPKKIAAIEIGVPPLALQQRFSRIVESVGRQKAEQQKHLAELDALFASLQSRAFRGEL